DDPDKIVFCIDTAHAYSYGYNLVDLESQKQFIHLIEECIGFKRVVLIHLNDTQEKLGSYIDKHALLGEGKIGLEPLKHFILHPHIINIPLILELPIVSEEEELTLLHKVAQWYD